jgi:hypothetical protein
MHTLGYGLAAFKTVGNSFHRLVLSQPEIAKKNSLYENSSMSGRIQAIK